MFNLEVLSMGRGIDAGGLIWFGSIVVFILSLVGLAVITMCEIAHTHSHAIIH